MKTTLLTILLALTAVVAVPAAYAEDAGGNSTAAASEGNKIGDALKTIKKFATGKKPNTNAKYYILLESASWCGPCNREMPNVVKQYPLMLKKDVQLIMISADQQPEAATHFMKRNRGDFPCIMGNPTTETQKLPGYRDTHAVPQAILVDAAGNVITVGPAQGIISNWAKLIKKK